MHSDRAASAMEVSERLVDVCDIVWLLEERKCTQPLATRRLLAHLGSVRCCDDLGVDSLIDALRPAALDGIMVSDDSALELAARLAGELGLPFHSEAVISRLTDKAAQRQALGQAGLPVPAHVLLPTTASIRRRQQLAASVTLPAVLKPRRGAASRETYSVTDQAHLDGLLASPRLSGSAAEDFALETFLPTDERLDISFGAYVSVETLVVGGAATHVGITGKFPLAPPFRESGSFVPAVLPAGAAPAIRQVAGQAAAAIGVRDGVLHTEIKLTPHGPVVIEVNGRVGGGGLDELYDDRMGISLRRLAAGAALGCESPPGLGRLSADGFAYAYFLQPPIDAHRVTALSGLDRLRAQPDVRHVEIGRGPGDSLAWQEGSQCVVAVTGTAPDVRSLAAVPAMVAGTIAVAYD